MFVLKFAMTRSEIVKSLKVATPTAHFIERKERIERLENGIGNVVAGFVVDEGHANGAVEHLVTDNGAILILNHRTKRAVTVFIARPEQIRRLYKDGNAPKAIIKIARRNCYELGLNY